MKGWCIFGLQTLELLHCGCCTAVCPLSTPRTPSAQDGQYPRWVDGQDLSPPEPWLCDYCGDAPTAAAGSRSRRDHDGHAALPTSLYDWTRLRRRFYIPKPLISSPVSIVACCGLRLPALTRTGRHDGWLSTSSPRPFIESADLTWRPAQRGPARKVYARRGFMGDLLFRFHQELRQGSQGPDLHTVPDAFSQVHDVAVGGPPAHHDRVSSSSDGRVLIRWFRVISSSCPITGFS
jgi:hypothetical protein